MTDKTNDSTTSQDDQFPTDSSAVVGGRVGRGKTTRHVEVMATISEHDEMETEWVDPKGDPDAQNLDVSGINPLDVGPLDSDSDGYTPETTNESR
jgi:hypothetical protein